MRVWRELPAALVLDAEVASLEARSFSDGYSKEVGGLEMSGQIIKYPRRWASIRVLRPL